VTYWLSKRFDWVFGYDISRSHLDLADHHLTGLGVKNVSLTQVRFPRDLENLPKVDLVYSIMVLQHNPPPIIAAIIRQFMRALNRGGIAFFQVPTYRKDYYFRLSNYLKQTVRHEMEMHVLPQHIVFNILAEENGKIIEVLEDELTGLRCGERSNTFVVKKRS
jgi:SAM-dependent methyltransferase